MTSIRQSDRAFGLTFAVVFTIVFAVGWFVFDAQLDWALVVAAVLLAIALACPFLLLPFNRLWARFAFRLAIINNFLLLGLFYYVFMVPLAVGLRLFGWDAMQRKIDRGAPSYWTRVSRGTDDETLRDMF